MNSQSKKTKVNEDVVHEHDNTAKTMLILKTHVHVDVDDWSSVDNNITLNVTCTFKPPDTNYQDLSKNIVQWA